MATNVDIDEYFEEGTIIAKDIIELCIKTGGKDGLQRGCLNLVKVQDYIKFFHSTSQIKIDELFFDLFKDLLLLIVAGGIKYVRPAAPLHDDIVIFHDAENCHLPRLIINRDSDGNVIRTTDGNLDFKDELASPIIAAKLINQIVREAIRCAEGPEVASENNHACDINNLSVAYNFVIHTRKQNFHPGKPFIQGVLSLTMAEVYEPDNWKLGAVDNKIKMLWLKALMFRDRFLTTETKKRTLFVLISGDRDFASDITATLGKNMDVIVICSEETKRPEFGNLIRSSSILNPISQKWYTLIEESRATPEEVNNITLSKLPPQIPILSKSITEQNCTSPSFDSLIIDELIYIVIEHSEGLNRQEVLELCKKNWTVKMDLTCYVLLPSTPQLRIKKLTLAKIKIFIHPDHCDPITEAHKKLDLCKAHKSDIPGKEGITKFIRFVDVALLNTGNNNKLEISICLPIAHFLVANPTILKEFTKTLQDNLTVHMEIKQTGNIIINSNEPIDPEIAERLKVLIKDNVIMDTAFVIPNITSIIIKENKKFNDERKELKVTYFIPKSTGSDVSVVIVRLKTNESIIERDQMKKLLQQISVPKETINISGISAFLIKKSWVCITTNIKNIHPNSHLVSNWSDNDITLSIEVSASTRFALDATVVTINTLLNTIIKNTHTLKIDHDKTSRFGFSYAINNALDQIFVHFTQFKKNLQSGYYKTEDSEFVAVFFQPRDVAIQKFVTVTITWWQAHDNQKLVMLHDTILKRLIEIESTYTDDFIETKSSYPVNKETLMDNTSLFAVFYNEPQKKYTLCGTKETIEKAKAFILEADAKVLNEHMNVLKDSTIGEQECILSIRPKDGLSAIATAWTPSSTAYTNQQKKY